MNYIQMTLDDWVEMKCKLKQELLGVRQSFVRIGYMLRKIEEQKGYEQDGYKSIAEFAQKELGLHPSTTTRFMKINQEYSIDGYSERLREEYLDLSRSQLEEMLKLPDEDRTMIQTDTSREGIRELKRFNNAVPETGANTIKELVESFFHDNKEILNAVFAEEFTTKQFSELVNPSGNRSYKKGLYFLMMYENRIAVKKFGETPVNMTWDEFKRQTEDIFQEAAGPDTWRNYFGEAEKTEQISPGSDEKHGNKNDCSTEKRTMENPKGPADDGREEKNDSKRTEADQEFDKGIEGRVNAVQTQENKGGEQIAPAQKTAEILSTEQVADEQIEGQMNVADYPEIIPENMQTQQSVVEETITRKEYLDTLTEYGAAEYLYKYLKSETLANKEALEQWFKTEVDKKWGMEVEQGE